LTINRGDTLPLADLNSMTPLEAALIYHAHGYRVVPWRIVNDDSNRTNKIPCVAGWNNPTFQPTENEIRAWWAAWPDAGIGLITNPGSGLVAMDIDVIADRQLAEAEHGQWNPTLTQISGRGGGAHHAIYQWPAGAEIKQGKLHAQRYAGIDVKSNGFVAVAPSRHPSGGQYQWDTSYPDEPQAIGYHLRQLLMERQEEQWHRERPVGNTGVDNPRTGTGEPDIDVLLRDGITVGGHDDTLRDVVWYKVLRNSHTRAEIELLWQAIVHRTNTDPANPFTAADFDRHYGSAVAKLADYRYPTTEDWMWEWFRFILGDRFNEVTPVPETFADVPEISIQQAAVRNYINLKGRMMAEAQIVSETLPPFENVTLAELFNEEPVSWVLPGVLPVGVVGLAGPPEAGKSLLIRDWLDAVANGTTWRQWRTTTPRPVTYVIGEGRGGIPTRFRGVRPDNITVCSPVALPVEAEVDRFIESQRDSNPGLIVFDMIYHMGVLDEDKSTAMLPLLAAARRISDELGCCVLLVGHPGHNAERRFRGTSALRGYFDAEFHMSADEFTCEKMKDGSTKRALRGMYAVEYPRVHWLAIEELLGNAATAQIGRLEVIMAYLERNPEASARQAGRDLAPELGISARQIERMVSDHRDAEG
jgi:hypothetical protein